MKTLERSTGGRRLAAALVAVALIAGVVSVAAAEQTAIARITVYEVAEQLRFKGPRAATDPDDFTRRLADASLLGTEVTQLSPNTLFVPGMYVTADASSNVSLLTYVGPVRGQVMLLHDIDPTRLSLDTLVIVNVLDIQGQLDLTTAQQGFAGIEGRWSVNGRDRRRGRFEGVFLIPFQIPGLEGYWYADLSAALPHLVPACDSPVPGLCPVKSTEFTLGIPLTKAVVTFYSR